MTDTTMELKVIDPEGGRKAGVQNTCDIHCVQCGEKVKKLIFCSPECEKNYNEDQRDFLDQIEALLPSRREQKQ